MATKERRYGLKNHYNVCRILFLKKASLHKNKIPPTAYHIRILINTVLFYFFSSRAWYAMIGVVLLTPNWYKDLLIIGQDKMFISSAENEIVLALCHMNIAL